MFFCKFCEIFKITIEHLWWLPLKYFIYMCVLIMKFFLSENKIKETSNNNQIYSFFETLSSWTSILDYFKLGMHACTIFLTANVKTCNISCFILKYSIVVTTHKVLLFWMFWKFITSKMIIQVQLFSSRTGKVNGQHFLPHILYSFSKFWKKVTLVILKTFFLYMICVRIIYTCLIFNGRFWKCSKQFKMNKNH